MGWREAETEAGGELYVESPPAGLPLQVSTVRMQGVILLLFAKYYHLPFLRDVQTDCTRTGLGGYWVSMERALSVACKIPPHPFPRDAPTQAPPQSKLRPPLHPIPSDFIPPLPPPCPSCFFP